MAVKYLILGSLFLAFNSTLLFTLVDVPTLEAPIKGIYPFSDFANYYDYHFEYIGHHLETMFLYFSLIVSIAFPKHARNILGQIVILSSLEIVDFADYMLTHNEFEILGIDINRLKLFVYFGVVGLTMWDDYKSSLAGD